MLYDCWRQTARARRDDFALSDLSSGRRWTFGQLASAVEAEPAVESRVTFLKAGGPEFVIHVLRAWRSLAVVCPLEAGQSPPRVAQAFPEGVVHLKTTSGTTGRPRLVAFTAEQLIKDARNIVSTMGLRADWPNLGVVSLAHSYGFSNLILPLVLHGIPLILVGTSLPEAVRHATEDTTSVTLAAVPTLWRTWHEADAIRPNVRLAISAGAPLSASLERRVFERHGVKIHNFYGSSECGGIAFDATDTPREDSTCVGAPLHNVDLSMAGDGCLEVRSRAVGSTYWPEPSAKLAGGIFRTNDLAELFGGLVFLGGRVCDQINVAGRKVLPETIEHALESHPQVRACLAFGVPSVNAQRGEMIVACVAGNELSTDTIKQFALSKLPDWQVPRDFWLVTSLEANGRGKLSRNEWRKRYLETAARKVNGQAL